MNVKSSGYPSECWAVRCTQPAYLSTIRPLPQGGFCMVFLCISHVARVDAGEEVVVV